MNIYKLTLSFKDYVYFTSREENRTKITIPILHNIGLQYAFKNAKGDYRIYDFIPTYQEDFEKESINEKFYIYPAIPVQSIGNKLHAHSTNVLFGWQSEQYRTFSELSSTNMLQYSSVSLLDPENMFQTYIVTELEKEDIPKYIRSGKTLGKIKVNSEKIHFEKKNDYIGKVDWWINPLDLPNHIKMGMDYIGNYLQMLPNGLFSNMIFKSPINVLKLENGTILPQCSHFQNIS